MSEYKFKAIAPPDFRQKMLEFWQRDNGRTLSEAIADSSVTDFMILCERLIGKEQEYSVDVHLSPVEEITCFESVDDNWVIPESILIVENRHEHWERIEHLAKGSAEHMRSKAMAEEMQVAFNSPEFECVNCNYTFKGFASCKCQLRITATMRDAILAKEGLA